MPINNNIIVSVGGGDRRNAFGGGRVYTNKTTLGGGMGGNQDAESITKSNLRSVFTIGLAFNKGQQANELVGAYTNNRLRQRKINTGMTFAKYGIGIAINPLIGGVYAAGDLAYRGIQYGIKLQKGNRQADYYRRLSGNIALSGSTYKGDYV